MKFTAAGSVFGVLAGLMLAGCATAPKSAAARASNHEDAVEALETFERVDPTLKPVLEKSVGYAVLPHVGKGGLLVGGGYGRGEVYEHGQLVGYCDLTQFTAGAQAGGQSYAELIVFQNPDALAQFERDRFALSAQASAVAIKIGAAAQAPYSNGVAIFTHEKAGFMAEATVAGQQFTYEPKRD